MSTTAAAVTVYSKPNCSQCKMTYLALGKAGLSFDVVDVTEVPAALAYITEELGYSQAPVVVVNSDPENHWAGFRPDKINGIKSISHSV